MSVPNIGASIRARLLNRARETNQNFNIVLTRYVLERLLYRMSISEHAGQFLLKGALLFDLWFDVPHRPTHDADFLCFGSSDFQHIAQIFRNICAINVEDGAIFVEKTVQAKEIRKEANYAGVRVTLTCTIGGARVAVQCDIGFGDAVTPEPEHVSYPTILHDLNAPLLRVYPRYTVVAEKLEALTKLGIANSRMKDYFDLWILMKHSEFDGETLRRAIFATHQRRGTDISGELPFGLTNAFAEDVQKQTQWNAFLNKNRLDRLAFTSMVADLAEFFRPVIAAAVISDGFRYIWQNGSSWEEKEILGHQN